MGPWIHMYRIKTDRSNQHEAIANYIMESAVRYKAEVDKTKEPYIVITAQISRDYEYTVTLERCFGVSIVWTSSKDIYNELMELIQE